MADDDISFATVNRNTRLFPEATMRALRIALGGLGSAAYTADLPAGPAGKFTVEHKLGTRLVHVIVYDTSVDPWLNVKVPYTSPAGGQTVILDFGKARTAGQYKVAVIPLTASSNPTDPTTPPPTTGVAPAITTANLEPMTQGAAFEQQLIASGTPEITWTVVSGAIAGLTLSTAGLLKGQPTNAGDYALRVRAVNAFGSVERTYTGTIAAPPVASSWSSYTSDSFTGNDTADINGRTTDLNDGGVSKQWVTSGGAYGITSGVLAATGTATGGAFVPLASTACEISAVVKSMPNSTAETHLFAMELCRSAVAAAGVSAYRVRMYATGNLAITRLSNGTETSDPIAISDPSSYVVGDIVTFRRVDNADHTVAYLSVRVNDREVAAFVDDTPLPAGSYVGFYREGRTGSFDNVSVRTQSTTVSLPVIQTTQLTLAQGSPTSQQIQASGDPTIVFSSISGKPAGLSLSDSGLVTGVPTGSGAYSWTVRATNAGGYSEKTFTGTIAQQGGSTGDGLVFGAEGRYYNASTPKPTDVFERTIEIDPSWTAMATAVNTLLAETPSTAKTRILVRPGRMPQGFSAGSSAKGVLQNLGSADRTWNILIMPRDGLFTVSGTPAGQPGGCAFVNVSGVTLLGFDFSDIGLIMRNSNRCVISHCFAEVGNFTANGGSGIKDCEYVECVFGPEDSVTNGTDRCAQRTVGGLSAVNCGWIGCYMATVQRRAGATGHCDAIQLSADGGGPAIGTRIIGCAVWSAANQAIIFTETPHAQQIYVEKTLTIAGGSRINMRYPQTPREEGGAEPTELYQTQGANSFVGGGVDITSKDNIFIGTVADGHTWKSVVNTKVSEAQANKQGTGNFTLDESLRNITKEQLDQLSPYPTIARQRELWRRQLGLAA